MKNQANSRTETATGTWSLAATARLGILADGRMGASAARAARIKTAITAQAAATA